MTAVQKTSINCSKKKGRADVLRGTRRDAKKRSDLVLLSVVREEAEKTDFEHIGKLARKVHL